MRRTAVPEGLSAVRVDLDSLILDQEATTNLYTPLDGEALAYVMYTSGSTGQPKGVMVPHRGITRLIWNNNYAQFSQEDRMAFGVNPSFDVSTLEVWAPLLNGGCIVVIRQKTLLEPTRFGRELEQQRVNILWLTVGLFNQYAHILQKQFAGLRYLMSGGDVLDPAVMARVLSSGHAPQHLINGYGPTESTTFTTTYEITAVREDGSSIPIGRPIVNTQVYILDAQCEPVPVGVTGELYIGGAGVAWGYLNRRELTAEKFLPDRFSVEAGARMYRTGDLCRWFKDGNIEFLGRNDFQVKIRGFRIELGEIEARLAKHPGVREAVVVAREEAPGDKRLVAYYTTSLDDGSEANIPSAEQLSAYLSASLPEYMVPAAFVALEAWPLTPNGKLDRRALPAPAMVSTAAWRAPRTPQEEILCSLFAEVLGVEKVGLDDHFFDLGGHSLMATRLVSRIRTTLGVELAIRTLFESPTVGELGLRLRESVEEGRSPLTAGRRPEKLPLSHAQQRLWFINRLEGTSVEYNMPFALRLKGELDRTALERALNAIVERHESLRTHFVEVEGEPFQVIEPDCRIELALEDMSGVEEREQQERVQEALRSEARIPFDLMRGPLLRAKLFRLGARTMCCCGRCTISCRTDGRKVYSPMS